MNDFLDILEIFPEIGTLEVTEKNVRGFQVKSHIRIFYAIKSDSLVILSFLNILQNPQKKNLGGKTKFQKSSTRPSFSFSSMASSFSREPSFSKKRKLSTALS